MILSVFAAATLISDHFHQRYESIKPPSRLTYIVFAYYIDFYFKKSVVTIFSNGKGAMVGSPDAFLDQI